MHTSPTDSRSSTAALALAALGVLGLLRCRSMSTASHCQRPA